MFTANMKLKGFILFWGFWGVSSYRLPSAAEKSLTVYGVEGRDITFPCSICASPQTSDMVEWRRVDPLPQVTMFTLRNGRELVKEKAEEYVNRTTMQKDGALRLSKVKLQDNGTYSVLKKTRGMDDEEVFFYLILVEASEVLLTIRSNSEGAWELLCESRGWRSKPVISVLNDQRNALTAQSGTRESDGRYSVNATAAIGNGTFICRVEIPDLNLWRESKISFTGDFGQSGGGYSLWIVLVSALLSAVATVALLLYAPLQAVRVEITKLYQHIYCVIPDTPDSPDTPDYTEYGDISKIRPTGASDDTAKAHQLHTKTQHQQCKPSCANEGLSGVEVSHQLASEDLKPMMEYQDVITIVGKKLKVHPALIAAIISRQSQAGTKLRHDGFGQYDPSSYGLMQVNKDYHAMKGGPHSEEHVDLGVLILIQAFKTMQRLKQHWTKEEHLQGALAAYIVGEERVIPLESHEVDSVTPYKDFSNDVIARAQWFAQNGF